MASARRPDAPGSETELGGLRRELPALAPWHMKVDVRGGVRTADAADVEVDHYDETISAAQEPAAEGRAAPIGKRSRARSWKRGRVKAQA